jgi:peptide/nickel transport system permease protein
VIGYVLGRAVWGVMLFVVLSLIVFVLFFVVSDAGESQQRGRRLSALNAQTTDGPVLTRYAQWMGGIARGSLGFSYMSGRPVSAIIGDAAPVTLCLMVGGMILGMLIAIPLGILAGLRPRGRVDRAATGFSLAGVCLHPLWFGLVLSYLVGYQLHALPASGYCGMVHAGGERCGGPTQWFTHMLMPWFTFALVFIALYVGMVQVAVRNVLDEDYVRQARAKGAGDWELLRHHVLRNAFVVIIPMVAMDIARLTLPTAIFVETAYQLPGVGRLLRQSLLRNDIPVIIGIVVVTAAVIVVVNFIGEMLSLWLDPRAPSTAAEAA